METRYIKKQNTTNSIRCCRRPAVAVAVVTAVGSGVAAAATESRSDNAAVAVVGGRDLSVHLLRQLGRRGWSTRMMGALLLLKNSDAPGKG